MPFKRDLALQNIPLSTQPFKTQPQIENEDVTLEILYTISPRQEHKCRAYIATTRSEVRWLILNSSHCIENMHHIIHAQISYEFRTSFLYP